MLFESDYSTFEQLPIQANDIITLGTVREHAGPAVFRLELD
ncbi:hypothetical protein ACOZ4B_08875 [Haloferax prahovense]|nr:hypothetical protein [Haloferax sp. Q22]